MTEEQKRISDILSTSIWRARVEYNGIEVQGALNEYKFHDGIQYNRNTMGRINEFEMPYELKFVQDSVKIVTKADEKEICAISPYYMLLRVGEDGYMILRRHG